MLTLASGGLMELWDGMFTLGHVTSQAAHAIKAHYADMQGGRDAALVV
jgi:hypothetical protein